MLLNLEFDSMMILILIAFLYIGTITGVVHEVSSIIKITCPFFIVFFVDQFIIRLIFNNGLYKLLVHKLAFITNVPFFNTVMMLVILVFIFCFSYVIIDTLVKFIQKSSQADVISFRLGKFDQMLGFLLGAVRFYLVMSMLILPFFLLNLTHKNNDFMTKALINHPPVYSEIGQAILKTEPVIDSAKSVGYLIDLFDLNRLGADKDFIYQAYLSVEKNREDVFKLYVESGASSLFVFKEPKEVLYRFLSNPKLFFEASNADYKQILIAKSEELKPQKGLLLWANELDVLPEEKVIEDFNRNYQTILSETTEEEMIRKLSKAYEYAALYYIVETWFSEQGITGELTNQNLKQVVEQLIIEFQEDKSFIINEIYQLKRPNLTEKLKFIQTFVKNYDLNYRNRIDKMTYNIDFKYQLIISALEDYDWNTVKKSPLISLTLIDTIERMHKTDQTLIDSESIYETLVNILFPVYILKDESFGEEEMEQLVKDIHKGLKEVYLTEEFALRLIDAFITNEELILNVENNAFLRLSQSDLLVIDEYDSKEVKELKTTILNRLESGDFNV